MRLSISHPHPHLAQVQVKIDSIYLLISPRDISLLSPCCQSKLNNPLFPDEAEVTCLACGKEVARVCEPTGGKKSDLGDFIKYWVGKNTGPLEGILASAKAVDSIETFDIENYCRMTRDKAADHIQKWSKVDLL